jgi:hypothetical protein
LNRRAELLPPDFGDQLAIIEVALRDGPSQLGKIPSHQEFMTVKLSLANFDERQHRETVLAQRCGRSQVREHRCALRPPSEQARQVARQFLDATATGDVRDLVALLTGDAALYADGGGRVPSAGRPILTADHVSRFFVGFRRRVTTAFAFRFVSINGRLGALMSANGKLDRAVSFEFEGDLIRAIYIVRNPEKLRHLAPLPLS